MTLSWSWSSWPSTTDHWPLYWPTNLADLADRPPTRSPTTMSVTAYLAQALPIYLWQHKMPKPHPSKPGLLVQDCLSMATCPSQGLLVGGSLSMTEAACQLLRQLVNEWSPRLVVQGKATKSEAACQRLSKSSRLGLVWLGLGCLGD